jgi:hypothetical protein
VFYTARYVSASLHVRGAQRTQFFKLKWFHGNYILWQLHVNFPWFFERLERRLLTTMTATAKVQKQSSLPAFSLLLRLDIREYVALLAMQRMAVMQDPKIKAIERILKKP